MIVVDNAIDESKSRGGKTVVVDQVDAKRELVSMAAVHAELRGECEQDVDDGDGFITYEGTDVEGNRWRVAVEAES